MPCSVGQRINDCEYCGSGLVVVCSAESAKCSDLCGDAAAELEAPSNSTILVLVSSTQVSF